MRSERPGGIEFSQMRMREEDPKVRKSDASEPSVERRRKFENLVRGRGPLPCLPMRGLPICANSKRKSGPPKSPEGELESLYLACSLGSTFLFFCGRVFRIVAVDTHWFSSEFAVLR